LTLGGGSNGGLYTVFRDPDVENRELMGDAQWALLRKLIEQRNPATIAVDISRMHAFSDGLSAGEREALEDALGPKWVSRVVRAENLALEYQSLRLPEMLPVYRQMVQLAHHIIQQAFSNQVITPGKTTTEDVVWWMRQELNRMGLTTWFQPSVEAQRAKMPVGGVLSDRNPVIIQRGDVLHCDFGITAVGLNTDTQHMGYVLREGESEPPEGMRKALAVSNRLQDLVMERMRTGRSGNEVLADSLAQMRQEKIDGSIYCHPVGDRGHGAGPLIGLWDRQQGVPGRGDVLLLPNSWFAIELQAATPVPEWNNQPLRVALEEDAVLDSDGSVRWVFQRQSQFHLVR
jgi:Xaa-Pro aminopeptidase